MRPGGEYRHEGEKDRSIWELRTFFLEKVAELAPEVLEDLQAEVLPVYRMAYATTQPDPERSDSDSFFGDDTVSRQSPEWVQWKFRDGDWEQADREELQAFQTQLRTWAEDHYLLEPWVLDAARRTLFFWYRRDLSSTSLPDRLKWWQRIYSHASVKQVFKDRDVRGALEVIHNWRERYDSRELRFSPRFLDTFAAPPFTFEFPPWVPQEKLWDTYERDLRDAFEQKLETYEQRRRRRPEDRDLDPPPEIRNPNHFNWLVLWQVKGWTHLDIAEEYGLSTYETPTGTTSSVPREAIHDKAELIGLTLKTDY